MAKLYNLARMTTATTGTGTITLGSAVSGHLTFALAGVTDGQIVTYAIEDSAAREIGRGTYTASGTTLTRTVLKSTNSDTAINLSGAAQVFITAAAEDLVQTVNAAMICGRLTLTTATPVLTSTTSAQTTVYYALYNGNTIPLYDGTSFVAFAFTELSQATTDSTKSPAAATTNSNYDMFVWTDSGTLRCTRGPAWSSDTSRGTGAGTTELERINGIWLNKVAITNGPAANRGTYVGTIRTDASSQCNMSSSRSDVWNCYNRVNYKLKAVDTTNSWTYTTAAFRESNGGSTLGTTRVAAVFGLNENAIMATAISVSINASLIGRCAGIGLDSSTTNSADVFAYTPSAVAAETTALLYTLPGLGYHDVRWLEYSEATGTSTWIGDNGAVYVQTGLSVTIVN